MTTYKVPVGGTNEWAERILFTMPESTEPFVMTSVAGHSVVVENGNAQAVFQVMKFRDEDHKAAFMEAHKDYPLEQVTGLLYLTFNACVKTLLYDEGNKDECYDYIMGTLSNAAEWLRKETGVC